MLRRPVESKADTSCSLDRRIRPGFVERKLDIDFEILSRSKRRYGVLSRSECDRAPLKTR